jgi:hypothetical protein
MLRWRCVNSAALLVLTSCNCALCPLQAKMTERNFSQVRREIRLMSIVR